MDIDGEIIREALASLPNICVDVDGYGKMCLNDINPQDLNERLPRMCFSIGEYKACIGKE